MHSVCLLLVRLNHLKGTSSQHMFSNLARRMVANSLLSIMALAPCPRLDILRNRSQLVLPAVLVQQVLTIAIAHLRHVGSLVQIAGLSVDAVSAGLATLAGGHEAVGDGEAYEDCETGAYDDEEGYEDAV